MLGNGVAACSGIFLLSYAGRKLNATVTAVLRLSDVLWAYLWEVVIFGQHPSISTIFGVILCISSAVLIVWDNVRQQRRAKNLKHSQYLELSKKNFEDFELREVSE